MQNRIYRFAAFELDAAQGVLKSPAGSVRLQEKPLRLLCVLLDHPQSLVSREQLRDGMWDSRTVVNFDQGINVAIKKVRDALGDSAENPQLIETYAKKGYRLTVPVEIVVSGASARTNPPPEPGLAHPAIAQSAPVARPGGFRRPILAAACLGVLGLAVPSLLAIHSASDRMVRIEALAVLPLQDLTPDPAQDFFADGITEEITAKLAQTLPLRVISRRSVMQFKKTSKAADEIAQALGVDAVLEGAVARRGDQVRVDMRLTDVIRNRPLWSKHYDMPVQDVLAIESDIARDIAGQLGSAPGGREFRRPGTSTVDPQTHELVLLGQHFLEKRTVADFTKAESYFQQALARSPDCGAAYAGLASVYALTPSYGPGPMESNLVKAEGAARQALALDDELAQAHATLAFIALKHTPDWRHSDVEFRRALEIDPSDATAHHWFAYQRFFAGQRDEALAQIAQARQLDPLSAIINADEGQFLYVARRFDEARYRLRRAMELAPELGQPHATLALLELEAGNADIAARQAREGLHLDPDNPRTLGEIGYVFAALGQRDTAQGLLARLNNLTDQGAYPLFPAMVEIGLGQRKRALDVLENMAHMKIGAQLHDIGQWHAFDTLQSEPRYRRLMAEVQ